jgi:hypothetical protein
MVEPAQYGPVLLAEVVGVVTITFTEPVDVQPSAVTVTVYTPASATCAFGTLGFCNTEEKALGPLQL